MTIESPAPAGTREGSWQQYDWVRESNVMVPMRDGARLATDIYRPARDGRPLPGPFPALMERTPYDKTRTDLVSTAKFFARRGYVVALQDVRGRFASEGEWYAFAKEGPDGEDAFDWLAAQPYCNGRIGSIGLSYSGSDQSALAALAPEGLAAMFVSEGMSNYHTSAMRQNGALEQRFLIYAFHMATTAKEALADKPLRLMLQRERAHLGDWLRRLPLRPGQTPLRHLPAYERWAIDIATHGDYDDYWKQPGYSAEEYYTQHKDVPVFLLGGWYDSYCRSTTDMYVALSKSKRGPVKLLMGPWVHGVATMAQTFSGDVEFGPDAAMDSYNDLRLR
jgi:putative CocE/NonD family hydrolase